MTVRQFHKLAFAEEKVLHVPLTVKGISLLQEM